MYTELNTQNNHKIMGLFGIPESPDLRTHDNSLRRNQILQGDCIEVMTGFPTGAVDLVVTDPPYLVNYRDRHGRSIQNDSNGDWLEPAFRQVYRVLKDNSFCVSFYGDIHIDKFMSAWKAAGFRPVGHIVWPKRYASSSWYLSRCHEQAFLLAKGRPSKPDTPLPDIQDWHYTGNKLHPTQKSIEIIKPLVECFSRKGDVVLDPFSGSGTTALAAKQTGRDYIGIDLEPDYVAIARKRLAGSQNEYSGMFTNN